MLMYFINRAGKGLSKDRRAELEKAKKILSDRIQQEKDAKELFETVQVSQPFLRRPELAGCSL